MSGRERIGVLLLCVAALWFALAAIYDKFTDRPVGSESVVAAIAPAVKRQPTAQVVIKAPVRAYQGKTKANLKLPAAVQADPHQEVIAAAQVRPDLRPQTVSTLINTETGAVETYVKTDPYPWLAIEGRGEARIAYGYKLNAATRAMAPVARLQVAYDIIRVKALTVGVLASVDSDRDAFAGVAVGYRW